MPDPISITSPPTNTSLSVLTSSCSSGRPADELALRDFEVERRTAAHGDEPATEIGAGRTGGRIFENRGAIGKEEPAEDLLRARRREHVGLPRAIDALELLEQLGLRDARAAPPPRWSAE